ncbi:MAG: ABC transporter ATP-binding protein [Candidatus Heimdallarchaeota archaeon]
MTNTSISITNWNLQILETARTSQKMEFALATGDPFIHARQRGTRTWILSHLLHGSNKLIVLIVFLGTLFTAILSASLMVIIGNAIDEFRLGYSDRLWSNIIIIGLISIGSPLLNLVFSLIRETLAQRMERETREEFYTNLLGKSQSFHDQQRIGDIMARTANDVRMLNFLVSPALSLIFQSGLNIVIPLVFIFMFYPTELLIVPLIYTILFIITLRSYSRELNPVTAKMRGEFGKMNAILNETLSGIEVVKASSSEEFEIKKYYDNAKKYRDASVKQGLIMARYVPLLLVAIAITLGLAHALILNIQGGFEVGQIIAYMGLLWSLRFPTFISIWVFALVRLAISGSERLIEVMNKESDIDENPSGLQKDIKGEVSFENVDFSYPGSPQLALKDINFVIKPGQTIAIVGTTGSGKTTLTKLISRLYDVKNGSIKIDGVDIKAYNLESLRSQISYIEQDVFLFSSSVHENISFGRTSSLKDVMTVAQEAQAHDFISQLPEGYDTEVGERGVQLSGGERQRVAIARAFLADPKILVLDDSTSAIDSETEDRIQHAITNILKGRTTFLITHRLSQIRWADSILVMKRGRLIAIGSHEELIHTSEEYRNIFVKRFDLKDDQILKVTRQQVAG